MIKRIAVLAYGVFCYAVFFACLVYSVGFVGNLGVQKSIDSAAEGRVSTALLTDLALIALFAVQHSVMARRWFKSRWTRLVPVPVERSTYVLASSLSLFAIFQFWQPVGGLVWSVSQPVGELILRGTFFFGWIVLLVSTFLIDHFDLFGLRQVLLYFRGRRYTQLAFRTPWFYRYVRHPIYVGWLLIFWSAPVMTVAHLVFALATTAYILCAIRFEERDLIYLHGSDYEQYRKRVPMLVPFVHPKDAPDAQRRPRTASR